MELLVPDLRLADVAQITSIAEIKMITAVSGMVVDLSGVRVVWNQVCCLRVCPRLERIIREENGARERMER